jgi:hypothetical protein
MHILHYMPQTRIHSAYLGEYITRRPKGRSPSSSYHIAVKTQLIDLKKPQDSGRLSPEGIDVNSRGWNPRDRPHDTATLKGSNRLRWGSLKQVRPPSGSESAETCPVGSTHGYSHQSPSGKNTGEM